MTVETEDDCDLQTLVSYVAGQLARAYQDADLDDLRSVLTLYTYEDGVKLFSGADRKRAYYLLYGAGRLWIEQEKAARSGYNVSDVAWYSAERVTDLLPIVLDESFVPVMDSEGAEINSFLANGSPSSNLLTMVIDVRVAVSKLAAPHREALLWSPSDAEAYVSAVARIVQLLGGERPNAPGFEKTRRRALSNANAIAQTGRLVDG